MSATRQSSTPNQAPRKILVLGATSGIAEATCRIWATQGASLFLVARNPQKLAAVAADLRTRGASYVDTAVADLDDTDNHPELLAHAVNSLTGMDIAYLAHGILGDQAEAEQDFNAAAQIIYTNYMAPVSLLTWLANFCVQRHAGTLAVISSVAGDRGRKSNYLYGSSKAGLSAFLAGLRNRVDREGVHVQPFDHEAPDHAGCPSCAGAAIAGAFILSVLSQPPRSRLISPAFISLTNAL